MINIYKAFILPHMEYCAPVLLVLSSGLCNKLELTNQFAIRTLMFAIRTLKSTPYGELLRHRLHGRSFNCNRIGFDAVTPFVYTAPVWARYQNRVVLKTLSKVECFQNDTVSLVVWTVRPHRFRNGLARNWLAREVSCSMRFPGHETISIGNRVRVNTALR